MEGSNFPTNNYTVQGLIQSLGQGHTIRFAEKDEILDAIDDDVAVVCITHVHYKTGHIHDMARDHGQGARRRRGSGMGLVPQRRARCRSN